MITGTLAANKDFCCLPTAPPLLGVGVTLPVATYTPVGATDVEVPVVGEAVGVLVLLGIVLLHTPATTVPSPLNIADCWSSVQLDPNALIQHVALGWGALGNLLLYVVLAGPLVPNVVKLTVLPVPMSTPCTILANTVNAVSGW